MTGRDYIEKRTESLLEDAEEILAIAEETNDFNSWSALKLILHSAGVYMYTKVMSNMDYYDDLYYIDGLAGSGVSTHRNHCFVGSPIVASRSMQTPFEKMFFIEGDPDKADALERRLEFVFGDEDISGEEPEDWEVIPENANTAIPLVVDEINNQYHPNGYHYYCFIDNQGMDVLWPAIESLAPEPYGDLLINLPTAQAIGRNTDTDGRINEFFGLDVTSRDTPDSNVRQYMVDLYLEQLADRDRSISTVTNVDANIGSYEYEMVYATRDITGGNGYMEVIDYVKERVESVHGGTINDLLTILNGPQSSLTEWSRDPDVNDETIEGVLSEGEDENQSSLDEWS